jgi:hypothetical protein
MRKWKDIKRKGNMGQTGPILPPVKPRGFISSNEYEVGQVIDLRVLRVRGFPDVPHVILSKKCYPQYGSDHQWSYEIERLPDNPMTVEDMEDIST